MLTTKSGLTNLGLKTQKTAKELVEEYVAFKPAPEFAKIIGKPSTLMTEHELDLEQVHLTEKLK